MKKTLLTCIFGALCAMPALATPQIETTSDGTLVVTVETTGDLNSENFTAAQLAAQKVKIVTANGYSLSAEDMITLCGSNRPSATIFSQMEKLDLSDATLASDEDYTYLNIVIRQQLKSFTFSKSLTKIPASLLSASSNASVLEEIIIPDNNDGADANVEIGSNAFASMPNLKRVVLGTGVQTIGAAAFANCPNLELVDYHEGIKRIEGGAFTNDSKLTEIVIPEGVEHIGYRAFANTGITSVRFPNTLKTIGKEAFDNTRLSVVVIPPSVEYIESQAFQNLPYLTDVYVLGTQTKAAPQAFQNDMTYAGYAFSDNGDGVIDRNDWVRDGGQHPVVLHYVEAAYENYAHDYLKWLKTKDSKYDHGYAGTTIEDQTDTVMVDGNIIPKTLTYLFQNNLSSDYGGWNQFFMTYGDADKAIYEEKRVIDGRWYSICYPFDMTATQIGNAFGSATEIREFSKVTVQQSGNAQVVTLYFAEPVTETKAHHPYMIYPGTHTSQTSVNYIIGVKNLQGETPEERSAQLAANAVTQMADNVAYRFIGNYEESGAFLPKNTYYYYGGDDTYAKGFYKTKSDNSVSFTPYSAAIVMSADNGAGQARVLYAAGSQEETTGITQMSGATVGRQATGTVYNLNGQAVSGNKTSKGIYIQNGKKYIVQ